MNIGYEDEGELKPYVEPPKDQIDEARIEKLIQVIKTLYVWLVFEVKVRF